MGEKGNIAGAADAASGLKETVSSGIDTVTGIATGTFTGVATGLAKDKIDEKINPDDVPES